MTTFNHQNPRFRYKTDFVGRHQQITLKGERTSENVGLQFQLFYIFFHFYVRILCFQNGFLLLKSAYSSLQKSEIRIHNSAEQDPILGLILLSCSVQSHALVSSKYKKLFYSCLHPALNRCLRLNQILNAGLPYTALVLSLGPKLKCLLKWYFLWNPILLLPTGWV